jgi:hypothetical protein
MTSQLDRYAVISRASEYQNSATLWRLLLSISRADSYGRRCNCDVSARDGANGQHADVAIRCQVGDARVGAIRHRDRLVESGRCLTKHTKPPMRTFDVSYRAVHARNLVVAVLLVLLGSISSAADEAGPAVTDKSESHFTQKSPDMSRYDHLRPNDRLDDLMRHPAFKGFSRQLLPWDGRT